ncbi:uncharacterized protein LOC114522083 [Dendronephthya gigantea]|uniref:uncharacterized protein LOC114522083 n=1 Tax=Dendronephthya gigantea TaxID=151771 RepID=UPI00106C29EF|nr:uncharacterized protein LOC114522083 [Dendronephthya gigantea]
MTKGSTMEVDFESACPDHSRQRRNELNMNETCVNTRLGSFKDANDSCSIEREKEDEDFYIICEGHSIPKEQDTTNYAEIRTKIPCLPVDTTTKPSSSEARRTRESDNPILRLDKPDTSSVVDCEKDYGQRRKIVTKDDFALYENTHPAKHVRQHGRQKNDEKRCCTCSDSEIGYHNTDSEIVYQNTSDSFNSSHVYENFERKTGWCAQRMNSERSTASNETSETESLYEDLDDVYEAMSPPKCASKPIDIVYTSIAFEQRVKASPTSVGSYSNSSSLGSLDRPVLHRSVSYSYGGAPLGVGKPPELPPQRIRGSRSYTGNSRRPRPQSLHMECQHPTTDFGLGLYTGTLVGCCIVTKTSPKSVQKVIGDYLAREKKDQSKPVSFQVTSESLRLGLNCAPWRILAENSVDDIGCITTYSSSNKTALGYTISKPGEDTKLFVIHCSDADQIKDAIVRNFKRPPATNLLSKWSSMGVLATPRSSKARSLPRMCTPRSRRNNEVANFDELVYLGSHKVKKSFLVVNDNISSVLDHRDSKEYTVAKIELYKDAIHLKNSGQDRILDIHQLEWILSMGLFDEDRRYFGYISSKAFQGSKTRTSCHVFRCNRVGLASQILETIRQACQATYLARTSDYPPECRSRTNSGGSTSSEGSVSSNSETVSLGSTSSSPTDVDWNRARSPRLRKKASRFLPKRLSRNRMTTIQSFTEEDTGIDTLGEETTDTCSPEEKPETKSVPKEVTQPAEKINQPQEKVTQTQEKVTQLQEKVTQQPEKVTQPQEEVTKPPGKVPEERLPQPPVEKPCIEKRTPEEKSRSENSKESSEKRFSILYLISTIVSPPLKPKHVKECLKQFQKSVDKAMKKSTNNGQHYRKAQLVFSPNGVMIVDNQTQAAQAFYERATISGVQSHPDGKCAFAFTTVVSGNTKHKCHLFLQDTDPIDAIVREIQTYVR